MALILNQLCKNTDVGILYGYNIGHYDKCPDGRMWDIFKVGMTSVVNGNDRIDSEMTETLSAGKPKILRVNGGDIPYWILHIAEGGTLKDLESEVHQKLLSKGAYRDAPQKELFIKTNSQQIRACMLEMINTYGGHESSYKSKIRNYLDSAYDDYHICRDVKYDNATSFIKSRADQFINKTISDVRQKNTIRKGFHFGGSNNNQTTCTKADFDYIVKHNIIQVIKYKYV